MAAAEVVGYARAKADITAIKGWSPDPTCTTVAVQVGLLRREGRF